jgi:hypothetical protein
VHVPLCRYPLSTPIFKKDRPSLADLGIGISLYFETVRLLSFIFLAMFIICLPSIVVAFLVQVIPTHVSWTLFIHIDGIPIPQPFPPTHPSIHPSIHQSINQSINPSFSTFLFLTLHHYNRP